MSRSNWLIAVVAIAAGSTLAGCGGVSGSVGGGGSASSSVVLGSLVQPTSYAANGAGWANESLLQQAVYDTLLHAETKAGLPFESFFHDTFGKPAGGGSGRRGAAAGGPGARRGGTPGARLLGGRRATARPVRRDAYAVGNSVPTSSRNSLSLNGFETTGSLASLRNCR